MPRKNFENIGVLQGYEYIRGVITNDPDFDTDTCDVVVDGVTYPATPIFYHCSEDAAEREDNGAIEGAAAGFAKDDEVIVLKQRQGAPGHNGEPVDAPKIFVIAHVDGIRPCCWEEPWDYDEKLSPNRVDWPNTPPGVENPYFTIEQLSPAYVWIFQDPGSVAGSGFPYPDGIFTISNENGNLKFYKPLFEEPYTISYLGDAEPVNPYNAVATFPYPPNSTGLVEPPPYFKQKARRVRVTVPNVIVECWGDTEGVGDALFAGTMFYVAFHGRDSDTLENKSVYVFFFTEVPLCNARYMGGINLEIAEEGKFCWCGEPYSIEHPGSWAAPYVHQYQETVVQGGLWFWLYSWSNLDLPPETLPYYYAYIPYGTDNAIWLDVPFYLDVNRIEIVARVHRHLEDEIDGHGKDSWNPEFTALVDKIEIC